MRKLLLALGFLLIGACGRSDEAPRQQPATEQAAQASAIATYSGAGRNRLCLEESKGRAAFITYGQGDANCTAVGSLKREGDAATLIPDGDQACQIQLATSGDTIRLGSSSPACSYYCGPSASFAGAEFRLSKDQVPVTDFAGEPLC